MDTTAATSTEEISHKPVHPFLFTILILPMGVSVGFVSVTLGYLLSEAGVSVEKIAALVGATLLPHIFKFIWAPLVDTTLSFKKWYLMASIISSVGIIATGIFPLNASSLPILTLIVLASQFAITFLCMATEGLMAYDVPLALKGRAGGFFQAGNLGGVGVGGGIGLFLAQRLSAPWMVSASLGLICLACCLALFFFKDPKITIKEEQLSKTYENLFKDVWNTIKTKSGLLALMLCFLTLGTGAAGNLWASIAKDWHVSADTVALVTGIASGLISAVGCMIGGYICDRMNSRNAYLLFGLLAAAAAAGLGYAPRTEMMFIIGTSFYAMTTGLCYAGFTAFVLEAIGKGAAATKYNIFAALSNSPIYLMTYVVGIAYTHLGAKGMLNTEAAFAVGAVLLFIVVQKIMYRNKVKVKLGM
ncbi:MAG: MFS transporter [Flavobacteriaceae bacterium]|nr:MFS transporter [Flavobacteriaceae bacterium]